uniref:Uncharacterized protein n=1 Tax=Rhizophora mucronata TaxID=61149 RepID=A0A2P2IH66_RHIMU
MDGGIRKLSGLSCLKTLNLDACQITDTGLAAFTIKFNLVDGLLLVLVLLFPHSPHPF